MDLSLTYFTHRTFTFEDKNFSSLLDYLSPKDLETFGWKFVNEKFKEICNEGYKVAEYTILKPLYEDFETNRKRLLWYF